MRNGKGNGFSLFTRFPTQLRGVAQICDRFATHYWPLASIASLVAQLDNRSTRGPGGPGKSRLKVARHTQALSSPRRTEVNRSSTAPTRLHACTPHLHTERPKQPTPPNFPSNLCAIRAPDWFPGLGAPPSGKRKVAIVWTAGNSFKLSCSNT